MTATTSSSDDHLIKILVTTDNHLGYGEKDPIRGLDSFVAFEECLQLAQENEVDFILLGGDLFHDSTPTSNSLHRCMKLLRQYTLGDKPIEFEIESNQETNFMESLTQTANFEDPNLNISIPVFSIHGNHDDPSGFGRLSSLDILSITGLVNYFGKWVNLDRVTVNPILIKKGDTKVALYGLSHIYDTRLVRLFQEYKVTLEKPEADWFNLMVLHQNRADRGPKNYLPEDILPSFLDLIIWGHEHDCRIVPEQNELKNFFVSQPGSTVPTSLSEGESLDKHCGLLFIRGDQFRLEPIKLQTIRPFVFATMNLADYRDRLQNRRMDVQEQVKKVVSAKVDEMLEKAKKKLTGHPKQPLEPIIRLRIQFENEEQIFNTIRFGQNYIGRVANPNDMILRQKVAKAKEEVKPLDKAAMAEAFLQQEENKQVRVEDIVDQYFETVGNGQKLKVLTSKCMAEVMRRLVDSEDFQAAEDIIEFHVNKAVTFMNEQAPLDTETGDVLDRFAERSTDTLREAIEALDKSGVNQMAAVAREKFFNPTTVKKDPSVEMDEDVVEVVSVGKSTASKGRTSAARAKAPRAAKAPVATKAKAPPKRGAKAIMVYDSSDSDS